MTPLCLTFTRASFCNRVSVSFTLWLWFYPFTLAVSPQVIMSLHNPLIWSIPSKSRVTFTLWPLHTLMLPFPLTLCLMHNRPPVSPPSLPLPRSLLFLPSRYGLVAHFSVPWVALHLHSIIVFLSPHISLPVSAEPSFSPLTLGTSLFCLYSVLFQSLCPLASVCNAALEGSMEAGTCGALSWRERWGGGASCLPDGCQEAHICLWSMATQAASEAHTHILRDGWGDCPI